MLKTYYKTKGKVYLSLIRVKRIAKPHKNSFFPDTFETYCSARGKIHYSSIPLKRITVLWIIIFSFQMFLSER